MHLQPSCHGCIELRAISQVAAAALQRQLRVSTAVTLPQPAAASAPQALAPPAHRHTCNKLCQQGVGLIAWRVFAMMRHRTALGLQITLPKMVNAATW
jgi:hypothetical protein